MTNNAAIADRDALLRLLRLLDLNDYQARAYMTLVGEGGLTAYEVGKRSGIPLSRCYEVMRDLVEKGLAWTQPAPPRHRDRASRARQKRAAPGRAGAPRYRALEPSRAVGRRRAAFARQADALEVTLERYVAQQAGRELESVWVLRGKAAILHQARQMVDSARWRLAQWLPEPAPAEVTSALSTAMDRRVQIQTRHEEQNAGTVAAAPLLVIRDGAEALLGELQPADSCLATYTRQRELVAVLEALAFGAGSRVPGEREIELVAAGEPTAETGGGEWLVWEAEKARRLLESVPALLNLEL